MLKNIYLCDDDEDDRELFQEALSQVSEQASVITSTNGEELLLQLYRGKQPFPDIIFLDLNMPRKDGLETLHEIKSHLRFCDIPIVILSTSIHPENIDATFCLGANRYIVKPGNFNDLKSVIRILITGTVPAPAKSLADYLIATHHSL